MRDHLIPLLIGEDVHDVERLWEKMFFCDVDLGNRALHVLDLGNRGVLMQAIAAIDNALWDAIGKLHNTPVYKLLGGYRDRVPVIAIGGYYYPGDPTHRALCDEILAYKAQGLYGVKMKVGRPPLDHWFPVTGTGHGLLNVLCPLTTPTNRWAQAGVLE